MALSTNVLLNKLLLKSGRRSRLVVALSALGIGLTLLLIAVLLWSNFNDLLHGTRNDDSLGSTFLTISKKVTPENMGHPEQTTFSQEEFAALSTAPEVENTGEVVAVKPGVWLEMDLGGNGFKTDMVLEAVPDAFMDRHPQGWQWTAGQVQVAVILPSSFLNLYNFVFAPSKGLPQLSEETIKSIPFKLQVDLPQGKQAFIGHIAGFSDRITSVLAPEPFVQSLNAQMPAGAATPVSRVILKVKDPSKTAFTNYLATHNYTTNSEQLRFSIWRRVIELVSGSVGIMALILLAVSSILFVLFIELTIARAVPSIHRLLEQGYSPRRISKFLQQKFIPMLAVVGVVSMLLCVVLQFGAQHIAKGQQLNLAPVPGWPVWVVAVVAIVLLLAVMNNAISKAISRIS